MASCALQVRVLDTISTQRGMVRAHAAPLADISFHSLREQARDPLFAFFILH